MLQILEKIDDSIDEVKLIHILVSLNDKRFKY